VGVGDCGCVCCYFFTSQQEFACSQQVAFGVQHVWALLSQQAEAGTQQAETRSQQLALVSQQGLPSKQQANCRSQQLAPSQHGEPTKQHSALGTQQLSLALPSCVVRVWDDAHTVAAPRMSVNDEITETIKMFLRMSKYSV